jgi:hypothetical protein
MLFSMYTCNLNEKSYSIKVGRTSRFHAFSPESVVMFYPGTPRDAADTYSRALGHRQTVSAFGADNTSMEFYKPDDEW